jgi:aldehyde oxidoreductase
MTLLDLLRNDLHLTAAKQGCDQKGQCGACTVILNGKAIRSCMEKVVDLDGSNVITAEGLGTPDNPHLVQEAFVLSGAVQCGYCTPGMVMATKALLDVSPRPTTEQIKRALRHNLCRCTGYVKVFDAVRLAGQFVRGELTPADVRPDPNGPKLGVSHPRPSAMIKACGVAAFSADIVVPGAIEVTTVRSPYAHADIISIDSTAALAMPGVVGVMTAKDVKGTNRLKINVADRPLICDDRVRVIGDPVAVVAAQTRAQAEAAAKAVKVEYKRLPVLGSPAEAMAEGAPQVHAGTPNLCLEQPQIKGDAEKALAESAVVVETHFTTQINHQAPLEPEASVAYLEGEGEDAQLVVIGRSINIHKHLSMIQEAVGWENARYEEAFAGGQFGIKIEVTSEGIAAAAALHFQRPVRYIPSVVESMQISPKRHPFDIHMKLGADANGRLTGLWTHFVCDNGAYMSISPAPINRALMMLSNSYQIPHVHALAQLVYTNNPWGAAARGAGPPQVTYALECMIDMLAEKMGIDPLEFRLRNSLKPGETKSTGAVARQWPFPEVCEAIRPHYERAVSDAKKHKAGTRKRGVGLGAGSFGIGQAGDSAIVAVELDPDDGITIYGAVADPGEGNDAMLTQLAADFMCLPLDKIKLQTRNTDLTTATGPAAGSRITFMVGGAMMDGLEQLKRAMSEAGATTYEQLKAKGVKTRYTGTKKGVAQVPLDRKTGQGAGFETEVHDIQLAEVEVDTETGEVRVLKMTTVCDAGPIINPHAFEGQLEGGMDQGAGYALREEYVAGKSRDWVTFPFPTTRTAFDMEVITLETPRERGTNRATGVGEMTLVPTAPAIINAIHDACGVWMRDLPATPEKVKAALAAAG